VDETESLSLHLPLKREPLTGQIADHIQTMITEGELEPGTRLPAGRELALRFGVSRATLSEAVRLLEDRGLVQRKVGSGTYVTDKSRSAFVESMERLFVRSNGDLEDLVAYREILEPGVAALAALCAKPEALVTIKQHMEEAEAAWRSGEHEHHVAADAAFHEALAAATGNEMVIAASTGIQNLLRTAIGAQHRASGDRDFETGVLSHRPVYEAITAHDADRARAAMVEHMRLTREASIRARRLAGPGEGIFSLSKRAS